MAREVVIPDDFDDLDWSMAETKGYLDGVTVQVDGELVGVTFYDPVRLAQDIEDDIRNRRLPHWKRLLVVAWVDRDAVQTAVDEVPDDFFV